MTPAGRPESGTLHERAPAKINLTLSVLARRPDGYSELASIVAFADLGERLVLRPAITTGVTISGPFAGAVDPHENSVLAADRVFRAAFPGVVPEIAYELEKEIPVAAGLGGGSADGAATLRGLVRLAGIDAANPRLAELALEIGADVPACLASAPALMTGIGERVRAIGNMTRIPAVLVNPRRELSTAAVFARLWDDGGPRRHDAPDDICQAAVPPDEESLDRAIASGVNDLERPARLLEPEVANVLDQIAESAGCRLSRMTGSGATCFGIYPDMAAAGAACAEITRARPGWWVRPVEIG